ncbi:helix-turn-helix domain-containing GNAT family N-acetyltransferase [Nocardioides sp. TF02-7]|uniref:bifunctional helix-turn-helix transcriptional regulator/GNAT family N-acetyltransferase n=1 Tax=Nocardioides sp. TF02-7 TaxID=2917724 RepID=UPI001F063996|nr:helix-turn-helix domain-containing GNAT family N-acetyltransferase [Nocardioides sp. TF02-7]UMG91680.1 helix-turn-helix domain-containing GNAT family N-acetyltransferase [Nocardioides sp. TF02-7]
MSSTTAVLRRFNRTFTQRIGVLDESFLGTGRPLAVSRLLFEVGAADGSTVRDLRERLDLDSGHLSRMLRRLERDGLVTTSPDPRDQRRRVVRLTDAGRDARQELDDRSEELAARLVTPLTARQRDRLADALATADLLVRAATVRLREVGPDDPAAQEATARYFSELDRRFPTGFDPGGPDAPEPGATYVVATSDGEPVAYGGIRPLPHLDAGAGAGRTAEIKRMWVHPGWRGAGLGSRMLRHLESTAGGRGFTRVVLDTNGTLLEAIAMYERAGYTRIERYNDNPYAEAFFAKDLGSSGGSSG